MEANPAELRKQKPEGLQMRDSQEGSQFMAQQPTPERPGIGGTDSSGREGKRQGCKEEVYGKSFEGTVRPLGSFSFFQQPNDYPSSAPAKARFVLWGKSARRGPRVKDTGQVRGGQSHFTERAELTDWPRVGHVTQTGPTGSIFGIFIL